MHIVLYIVLYVWYVNLGAIVAGPNADPEAVVVREEIRAAILPGEELFLQSQTALENETSHLDTMVIVCMFTCVCYDIIYSNIAYHIQIHHTISKENNTIQIF